jgi:hypothetical protein
MVVNGPDILYGYGQFLGERYAHLDNIVWVEGGDGNPPNPDLVDAIASGISDADPDALHTAHLAPDTAPRDFWSTAEWLDVDNVYTYDPVVNSAADAYRESALPFILMESAYENEHEVSNRRLRTQAYQALFTGATGQIFGNNPIWHFDGGGLFDAPVTWEEALDGPGSSSMAALARIISGVAWWDLRPDLDRLFLTDGIDSGQDRAVAAVSSDSSWAIVYVPTRRVISLVLTQLDASNASLSWFDPTSGEFASQAIVPVAGEVDVEVPDDNAGDDADWVLVVQAA